MARPSLPRPETCNAATCGMTAAATSITTREYASSAQADSSSGPGAAEPWLMGSSARWWAGGTGAVQQVSLATCRAERGPDQRPAPATSVRRRTPPIERVIAGIRPGTPVSYTHLRAHETDSYL